MDPTAVTTMPVAEPAHVPVPGAEAEEIAACNENAVNLSQESDYGDGDEDGDSGVNVHCGARSRDVDIGIMFSPIKTRPSSSLSSSIPIHIKTIISTPSTIGTDVDRSATTEIDEEEEAEGTTRTHTRARTPSRADQNHHQSHSRNSTTRTSDDDVSSISSGSDGGREKEQKLKMKMKLNEKRKQFLKDGRNGNGNGTDGRRNDTNGGENADDTPDENIGTHADNGGGDDVGNEAEGKGKARTKAKAEVEAEVGATMGTIDINTNTSVDHDNNRKYEWDDEHVQLPRIDSSSTGHGTGTTRNTMDELMHSPTATATATANLSSYRVVNMELDNTNIGVIETRGKGVEVQADDNHREHESVPVLVATTSTTNSNERGLRIKSGLDPTVTIQNQNKTQNLETELHVKDVIIQSQREEIERYNGLIQNYRDSVREKNVSLRSMEKILSDMHFQQGLGSSSGLNPGLGHERENVNNSMESAELPSCSSIINHGEKADVDANVNAEAKINMDVDDELLLPPIYPLPASASVAAGATTTMASSVPVSVSPPLSPRAARAELRVYKQIVVSLTDENNAFRIKDAAYLAKINELEGCLLLHKNSNSASANANPSSNDDADVNANSNTDRNTDTNTNVITNLEHKRLVYGMQREIDEKNDMLSSMFKQNTTLADDYAECQVKIADLGQEVIRMERELDDVQRENETLQKLLRTSREAVMNLSTENSFENEPNRSVNLSQNQNVNLNLNQSVHGAMNVSFRSDGEGTCSSADAGLSNGARRETMGDPKDDSDANALTRTYSSVGQHQEPVVQSLINELEATKKREQDLRDQLASMANDEDGGCDRGSGYANKDSIMEKLSESQQEAIIYLNGEVSDLRKQLEEEKKKMASHLEASKTHKEKIEVLEYENKLAVEETIKNEKLLEAMQQDLSIKLGENACFRDEIAELEEKASKVDQLKQQLIETQKECEKLEALKVGTEKKAAMGVVSVGTSTKTMGTQTPQGQSSAQPKHTQSQSTDDNPEMNMDDATLMTVEIDAENDGVETEVFAQAPTLADHRQFSVLKKALKAKYEKKQRDLETVLKDKEAEIRRLSSCLEDQQYLSQKQVEEIQDIEIRRISHEAEMNEELENLRMSLKERSMELVAFKEKVNRSRDKKSRSAGKMAWKRVSDTLIDGVAASIEIFDSMYESDVKETKRNTQSMQKTGTPARSQSLTSAKSFG